MTLVVFTSAGPVMTAATLDVGMIQAFVGIGRFGGAVGVLAGVVFDAAVLGVDLEIDAELPVAEDRVAANGVAVAGQRRGAVLGRYRCRRRCPVLKAMMLPPVLLVSKPITLSSPPRMLTPRFEAVVAGAIGPGELAGDVGADVIPLHQIPMPLDIDAGLRIARDDVAGSRRGAADDVIARIVEGDPVAVIRDHRIAERVEADDVADDPIVRRAVAVDRDPHR